MRKLKSRARTLLISIISSLLIFACKNNNTYSGDHLPPKVMQKVLLDINLAEAYSATGKDSLRRTGIKNIDSLSVYYKDIFAHYSITQEQFSQSLTWYKNHAGNLDSICANLMPVITAMQKVK